MKVTSIISILFFSLSGISSALAADITFDDARVLIPIKGTTVTAGYGNIVNSSSKPVTLTVIKAKDFKAVELHQSFEKDGRMGMEKVDSITIEPGKTFELKPGGYHVMLFDALKPLKENNSVIVVFKVDGKPLEQKFNLVPREQASESHHHH